MDRNRHRLIRFDADPNPNFHFGAHPDTDPDWHQNDADPHADPTASYALENRKAKQCQFIMLFSHQWHWCHSFYFFTAY